MELWQSNYIRLNASEMSAAELAEKIGSTQGAVRRFCSTYQVRLKRGNYQKKEKHHASSGKRMKKVNPGPPKTNIERPPAVYNNTPSPYAVASSERKL